MMTRMMTARVRTRPGILWSLLALTVLMLIPPPETAHAHPVCAELTIAPSAAVAAGATVTIGIRGIDPVETPWRLETWTIWTSAYTGWQGFIPYHFGGGNQVWDRPNDFSSAASYDVGSRTPQNVTGYFRGAWQQGGETHYTPTFRVVWGAGRGDNRQWDGELWPNALPPYPDDTLCDFDDLVNLTPGGDWIAQMLVSVGAAAAVLWVLRGSALGLFAGVGMMPLSAGMMAALGWGGYWYAAVTVLLLILVVLAWGFLVRR